MTNKLICLPDEMLSHINGGGVENILALAFTAWKVLEVPHMISGLREFVNYMGDRYYNGCTYEPNDHFTASICYFVK